MGVADQKAMEDSGLRSGDRVGTGVGRCSVLAPAAALPSRALPGEGGRSLHPQASCWGTSS